MRFGSVLGFGVAALFTAWILLPEPVSAQGTLPTGRSGTRYEAGDPYRNVGGEAIGRVNDGL
ncbi:MAG: hypothetical protein AAFU72_11150, partial [Pseudomonadota bacterium]